MPWRRRPSVLQQVQEMLARAQEMLALTQAMLAQAQEMIARVQEMQGQRLAKEQAQKMPNGLKNLHATPPSCRWARPNS